MARRISEHGPAASWSNVIETSPVPTRPYTDVALVLLALSLAVSGAVLGRENFWADELSSLYFSEPTYSLRKIATQIWPGDTNPPLYYLTLYLWRQLVPGVDEFSIRAASLVPAALACLSPLIYSSRVMRLERRLAVIALLSCSPGLLYFAGEARGYALVIFFSVNLCFLLLSAMQTLRAGGSIRAGLALLSAFCIAAAWTHFFGILLAASAYPILLAASVFLRRNVLLISVAALLTALAVTVWPLTQWSYIREIAGSHWFISGAWEDMFAETKWFTHLAFGARWSVLAIAALTMAAMAYAWNRQFGNKELLFCFLALFFGWVIGLSLYVPIFYSRYFVVALPAIYMLVAEAIGDGAERLSGRPSVLPFALILPMAGSFAVTWPAIEPTDREDWRAPATVVNQTPSCAGAPIFVVSLPRDSGDSAYLYGHYLDAPLGIQLIPVDASAPIDSAARQAVWNSSCPVKFWGAHVEAWQLAYLARAFAQFTPGFQLLPFRRGFLLVTAGPETSAKRD
jgi:hypothetical protein